MYQPLFWCMLSCFSHVVLFEMLWTVAHQVPGSKGFSRQEYRSGWPFPPPGKLPNPGVEPVSLTSPASADRFFTASATRGKVVKLIDRIPLRKAYNTVERKMLNG